MSDMARPLNGVATNHLVNSHSKSKDDTLHGPNKATGKERNGRVGKVTLPKHKLQRSSRKTNHGHVQGDGEAVDGDGSNEDDEDSNEQDEQADEDEEGEAFAPSGGLNTNKPTVRIDSVSSESTIKDADHRQTGPANGTLAVPTTSPKKRTFSNLSILSADEANDAEQRADFPRKKVDRKLSNNNGLFQYDQLTAAALRSLAAEAEAENAIASDDDDEIYKKVEEIEDSDDEIDADKLDEAILLGVDVELEAAEAIQGNAADEDDYIHPDEEFFLSEKIDSYFGTGMFGPQDDIFANSASMLNPFRDNDEMEIDFTTPTARRKSEGSERRVRFDDKVVVKQWTSSSSSGSSDIDVNVFPDLLDNYGQRPFTPLDTLNPELRAQIAAPDEEDFFGAMDSGSTSSSEFDFGETEAALHLFKQPTKEQPGSGDSADSESGSLSGYDSDGDTTDDDLPPPQTVTRPKTVLHSPPMTSRALATPKAFPRNTRARLGPRMGTFTTTPEAKPIAFYDARSHRIRILNNPKYSRGSLASANSSASNSPLVSFNGIDYESDNGFQMSSLFHGNVDVMMSGIFGGPPGQRYQNGQFVTNSADLFGGNIGTPETFFAQTISEEGSPSFTTESDFDDIQIDVDDFIQMQSDLDDEDENGVAFQSNCDDETSEDEQQTPVPKKHTRRLSQNLMAHFDRLPSITSFKNNQDRYRVVSRMPHDGSGRSQPLKTGKTAQDVMTPPRKKKNSISKIVR